MIRKSMRPIGIDLFAGAGGMSLGFEQAGFDIAASVEIDPIHCATHEYNFPETTVICAGVEDVTGERIRERAGLGAREIDVVFGGPPCQGFSLIGKRTLDDPRNSLLFHFLRLVVELQPRYFVMENVSGLAIGKHKHFLVGLMEEFGNHGYHVEHDYRILNAAHYGVPQNRKRLFLLGSRSGLALPRYPLPVARPVDQSDASPPELHGLMWGPTVRDALSDIPDADGFDKLCTSDSVPVAWGNASRYAQILHGDTRDPHDYSYPRTFLPSILTSSTRTEHTRKSIERFSETEPGQVEPISRFFRLDPDGLCNTLRAGTASNRGAFTSPRPIHPDYPRCITVREAARLHSYPDWFRFHVTKWHGFRQVGNSVPPLLARAVAAEIIKALRVRVRKPKKCIARGDEALLGMNMSQASERYGVDAHVIEPRRRSA